MLVWQNQIGEVYVSYNTAAPTTALLARHGFDASDKRLIAEVDAIDAKEQTVAKADVK